MHPVIAAWLALLNSYEQQPKYTEQPAYANWLIEAEERVEWWHTVRRWAYV